MPKDETPTSSEALLLFGATGDLAKRMLLPSLYALHEDGLIAEDLRIVGTARSELSDDEFRELAGDALSDYLPEDRKGNGKIATFLEHLQYQTLDASKIEGFGELAAKLGDISGGLSIFLSTAPSLFEATIAGLKSAGLTGDNVRIGLEKPLGNNLESSNSINDAVAAAFTEEQTFRIDHYLGKETVQNLIALRFANMMFEPLWNAAGIDHVEITVSETVGLEGRHGFYDDTGAMRDMVQNHLLQLLSLVAMEPPTDLSADGVRDEKVKVLRSMRQWDTPELVAENVVRGQYVAGHVDGEKVVGYREEDRVDPESMTESYVALKVLIDTWRWSDVPFYVRMGKQLPKKATEISVHFKEPPTVLFNALSGGVPGGNVLVIRIQPDEGISLRMVSKIPGASLRLEPVKMDFHYATSFGKGSPEAYERLLLDSMAGDATLFARRDEVEEAWKFIDHIEHAWHESKSPPPMAEFVAGTWGPKEADDLLAKSNHKWRRL